MNVKIEATNKHINFVKSYLIKTKEALTNVKIDFSENTAILTCSLGVFTLLDFPEAHDIYVNGKIKDEHFYTTILAIPESLKGWNESE